MPIIIDHFQINNANPIENRIVVGGTSFYQTRDLIQYKYPGLRTWDLNDNLPYYWTGAEWLSENSTSVKFDNTVDIGDIIEPCICIFNEAENTTTNIISDKHKGSEIIITYNGRVDYD
jgi:hypothetical protein